jgi:1-acyl-sn-glycerol-3-phosphate acyltransferase
LPDPSAQNTATPQQPRIHPALLIPYLFYKWVIIIPTLLISTLIIGSLIIVLCFVGLTNFAPRVLATLWARLNAFVTLMKVEVHGKEHLEEGRSYILAANHLSLVDIYVLYGFTGLNLRWVMKKELRKVPVLGLACELMGHIYVDRSATEKALESIQAARERIQDDMCVVFFPEGTRSRTSELRTFKKGAFRMAQDLGIPVVPVSINNTNRIVPSDTLDWRPGAVSLTFHQPIPVDKNTDINKLAIETRAIIVDALNNPVAA